MKSPVYLTLKLVELWNSEMYDLHNLSAPDYSRVLRDCEQSDLRVGRTYISVLNGNA